MNDDKGKILLICSTSTLEDMIHKGNIFSVRHYESYFTRVFVSYIFGYKRGIVQEGNTSLISIAEGEFLKNLLYAPFRIYKLAKEVNATSIFTADQFYSFWTLLIIKLFYSAKIYLSPDCMPDELYKSGRESITIFPRWLERRLILLSFRLADHVIVLRSAGSFTNWMKTHPIAKKKMILVDTVVHALPTKEFYNTINKDFILNIRNYENKKDYKLLYVGRLHSEKFVTDIILMMKMLLEIKAKDLNIIMLLIGDGPERDNLEKLSIQLGIKKYLKFLGYIPNEKISKYYLEADIFISPLTGNSLREAGLCGLPIVAYNIDWVNGILVHGENSMLVEEGDYENMAKSVNHLINNNEIYHQISSNIIELAWEKWSTVGLLKSLQDSFRD